MDQLPDLQPVEATGCRRGHCWHDSGVKPVGIDGEVVWPAIRNPLEHCLHPDLVHLVRADDIGAIFAGVIDLAGAGAAGAA